jgi:hypothetical protein
VRLRSRNRADRESTARKGRHESRCSRRRRICPARWDAGGYAAELGQYPPTTRRSSVRQRMRESGVGPCARDAETVGVDRGAARAGGRAACAVSSGGQSDSARCSSATWGRTISRPSGLNGSWLGRRTGRGPAGAWRGARRGRDARRGQPRARYGRLNFRTCRRAGRPVGLGHHRRRAKLSRGAGRQCHRRCSKCFFSAFLP